MLGKWVYGYSVPLNVIKLLNIKEDHTLCLIGSGLGETAMLAYLETKAQVNGFEIHPQLVMQAENRTRRKGLSNKIKYHNLSDLDAMRFSNVDAVFFESILSYLKNPDDVLSKAITCLKPGGRLGVVEVVWTQQPSFHDRKLLTNLLGEEMSPRNTHEWMDVFHKQDLKTIYYAFRKPGFFIKLWDDMKASPVYMFPNLFKTLYSVAMSAQSRSALNNFLSFFKYFKSKMKVECYVLEKKL
ncbi:MAG: class I SAM-dependent methyltransferase [Candidatus Caldarchaeum sp.]